MTHIEWQVGIEIGNVAQHTILIISVLQYWYDHFSAQGADEWYFHFSARGAAESVETLDKLRQTRDTLNDILTENDQLKIEVSFNKPFVLRVRHLCQFKILDLALF